MSRKQLIEFFATFHACTVVMEACAGSHQMARKLAEFGHAARLISPQFVRPFVKSNKNDFVDAEAICETASRPAMRFVTPKTESQQTLSVLHRVRESMVRERTRTVNQMHSFLLEFGISLPVGNTAVTRLPAVLAMQELPPRLVAILERLHEHFKYLEEQIGEIDHELARQLADDEVGQRLMSIPGVGPVTASALAAKMGAAKQYGCSRDFAASVGLVPRQFSTGGKTNLLGISRRGDKNVSACSSCAPEPTCEAWKNELVVWQTEFAQCSRNDIQTWWHVRWPTSWPERPGPLLHAKPHSTLASQLALSEGAQLHLCLTQSPNWFCDD